MPAAAPTPAPLPAVVRPVDEAQLSRLSNKNRPSHYAWARALLESIARGEPPKVGDLVTGVEGAPMFVVAGACPSMFAPMQAVLYAAMGASARPAIDFWWIKPASGAPAELEAPTLNRHAKGAHKNDPGRSKVVYAPLASLFANGGGVGKGGLLRFGIETSPQGTPRAWIEPVDGSERYYLCLVWQEEWSNPLSRTRYIKGKLVYQKSLGSSSFFARPYGIVDDVVTVPSGCEECVDGALPSDSLKVGCVI